MFASHRIALAMADRAIAGRQGDVDADDAVVTRQHRAEESLAARDVEHGVAEGRCDDGLE